MSRAHRVSRRDALKMAAGGAVTLGVATHAPWARAGSVREAPDGQDLPILQLPLLVTVVRRDDLLNLRFLLYNMVLDTSTSTPVLMPRDHKLDRALVVQFPFQSIGEQCAPGAARYPATPMESLASGPSQLAFLIGTGAPNIPFTLEALLRWSHLVPILQEVPATLGTKGTPSDPARYPIPVTHIEAAWRLQVSPDLQSTWTSSATPVTGSDGWTELWSTRLVPRTSGRTPNIWPIWTPGYPHVQDDPILTSLGEQDYVGGKLVNSGQHRRDLVALATPKRYIGALAGPSNYVGTPAKADLFMLTPLGISMNLQGTYDALAISPIISWTHRTSVGRDTFVRVVEAGFLYPFGNKAVRITTSAREWHVSPDGDVVAYLVQRVTVEVTQPTITYSSVPDEPNGGRQNPLRAVEFTTLLTPTLDQPSAATQVSPHIATTDAMWVQVGGKDLPFTLVATDIEGRTVDFSTGVVFVLDSSSVLNATKVADLRAGYNGVAVSRRQPTLGGQLLAFAAPGSKPGSTAQHVDAYTLDSTGFIHTLNQKYPTTLAPWFPVLSQSDGALVRLPAASQISGGGADTGSAPVVTYDPVFLTHSFRAGLPEVYLRISHNTVGLSFTANATAVGTSLSGGMVTPNFTIDGLARDLGPVADAASLVGKPGTTPSKFDPTTFFGTEAKILGGLALAEICKALSDADIGPGAPKITSVPIYPGGDDTKPPIAVQTTVDWTPTAQSDPAGIFEPLGELAPGSNVTVHVNVYAPLSPSATNPATQSIDGELVNFNLNLFGSSSSTEFIVVHFVNAHFSSRTGSKATVTVNIDTVTFVNALSFIQDFEQLFASLGGPSIDIEPSGITAGYTLAIPSIGIGVFSLENLSLGGTLTIPFTGQPVRLRVNFCTRENPFLLSIYVFTGGGFFSIALGADGIEAIEVSLEFGASISLDLGVASGGVSIMAGIYFMIGSGDNITLTGFFQASGNLDVLGIISISIVFYLALTYQSPGNAYGTASVTVTVSVLCFSASVSLTVTKQIAGGDPAISVSDAISESQWGNYCASFASAMPS